MAIPMQGSHDPPLKHVTINDLPTELLQHVLFYVPALSIPSFQQTCRRFASVVEAFNWRHACQTRFRYWDSSHGGIRSKIEGKETGINWKRVFIDRHLAYRETSRLLDSLLSTQVGRIHKFQRIVEIGYDAKDCLLQHLAVDENAEDVLARRYYSDAALGCLHRAMAINKWSKLQSRQDVALEEVLTAFDMFVLHERQGDFDETTARLNAVATDFHEQYPGYQKMTTHQKATLIAKYLLQHNLVGLGRTGTHHYHDLQNNFIGFALHDKDHPSLPLISAAIYCCVARRLGVDASPCALPFHVMVVVRAPRGFKVDGKPSLPDEAVGSMYMDPFETDQEVSVSEIVSRLRLVGALESQQSAYLEPTPVSDLVVRTSRNILMSVQESHRRAQGRHVDRDSMVPVPSFADLDGAFYGALWASLLLGIPANGDGPVFATIRRRTYLPTFVEHFETHFPTDVSLIENHIIPMFQHSPEFDQLQGSVRVMRSVDSMPKQVKRRTKEVSGRVRYNVGQVFQHKRYNYLAVITGWDTECGANEQWMAQMRVHELSRGPGQSFYHVLVEDKSVRYVAEENINVVKPDMPDSLMSLAGKYFKRWDKKSRCFVSNIKDEYPDD